MNSSGWIASRCSGVMKIWRCMQLSKPMFKNLLTALQLIDAEAELVAADNGISTFVSSESTYSIFRLNWNSSIGLHLLWFFPSTKDI